jgi:quinone-modifying oxidoreductase subunit QmoC
MEGAGETLQERPEIDTQESPPTAPVPLERGRLLQIEPDMAFIRALRKQGGATLKKCMQCGNCSATCELSPDTEPFPRKEMAWANWGMKDRLLTDPDVWLCHQCHDCSMKCPRGARPGDVLGAVRCECVRHYALPRFLGNWMGRPWSIPLLLGLPAAIFALAIYLKGPVEGALGLTRVAGERIHYSYSSMFPHWMLNSIFGFFTLLVLIAVIFGVSRYWRALKSAAPEEKLASPAKTVRASVLATLKNVFTHEKFSKCTIARPRYVSHLCIFFGFLALTLVTLWVITARYNPLIRETFIYPFGFWYPFKMLANAGGAAVLVGCLLMIFERFFKENSEVGVGSYFDWALLFMLLFVVLSGFATEALHFLRLEPHRHVAYFAHLVFAFALLMYMPYSKLAHILYRCTAMVFAEHTGRDVKVSPAPPVLQVKADERERMNNAGDTSGTQ